MQTLAAFLRLLIRTCRDLNDNIGASGEPRFSSTSVGVQLYERQHAELVCDGRQGPGTAQVVTVILSDRSELLQS